MDRRHFVKSSTLALAASTALSRAADPAPPKIKIAQIGTAHAHASGRIEVYRSLPDLFDVVGIAEPDDARWLAASKTKAYAGLPRIPIPDLLNTPHLQAVAVESPIADLLTHAESCIDAGLHIHLDKPPGSSLPHFKRILDKADAKGLTVQMGYMFRYNPAVILLRHFLENGWLGEIFEVHAVMGKVVSASERKSLAQFKGGIMFELGCHVVDLVVSVLGKPDSITPHIRHLGGDELADNILAVFTYPHATATVRSSATDVEGFARRQLTVAGSHGSFHIQPLDRPAARIALDQDRSLGAISYDKGITDVPFDPPYQRYVGDAIDLARIIRGQKKSDFPSSHDLAVQDAVLRASGMTTD